MPFLQNSEKEPQRHQRTAKTPKTMKTKTSLLAFLAALASSPNALADFSSAVLADDPLVYYRFEEGPGAVTLADSSGNGLDIDYSFPLGTTVLGEEAAVGKGARFNGDGSLVSPLLLDPSLGDFSLEVVVSAEPGAGDGVILANQDGALGPGRSNLVVNNVGVYTTFSGGVTTNSGVAVATGEFDHIILTYDQSASLEAGTPTFRFFHQWRGRWNQ